LIPVLGEFLTNELKLTLHPDKVLVQKWYQGVDFLGFIHFPYHMVMRTKTKKRIIRKISLAKKELKNEILSDNQYNEILQ
jgi:hypothetical protein